MSEILNLMGGGWLGAFVVMAGLWWIQLRTRNAGIVDVGWAAVTGGLAVWYAITGGGVGERRILLGVLGAIWGGRLAWHLLRDRVWGQPEEGRYVALRQQWAPHENRAFFIFYQAQALAALLLSLPFALAAISTRDFPTAWDLAGLILVVVGVTGESIADRQLLSFKRDPENRGRTCRAGLWRYSRHPNYFFEWILWCGFGIFPMSAPWGWVGMAAPLFILYSILFVTGIPPTEAQALRSRGEEYRRYQRTTSAFVPWPPRDEDTTAEEA